jgi:membrane-associated phospholipid phosphatase
MLRWEIVALGYVSYLAVCAFARPQFNRARRLVVPIALASWLLMPLLPAMDLAEVARALLPLPVLLGGYWLSGTFFVAPMVAVEATLARWDALLLDGTGLRRWYRHAHPIVHGVFEAAYLLVYPMVPVGALTLVAGGRADHLGEFWTAVLLAAFGCYGTLPWIQTRAPRALGEPAYTPLPATPLRRLNEFVLGRGSIQVNTIPSGHAAAAVAVALSVATVLPAAGALLFVLAALITTATVLGGYHYAVDSISGVIVGLAATLVVTALR